MKMKIDKNLSPFLSHSSPGLPPSHSLTHSLTPAPLSWLSALLLPLLCLSSPPLYVSLLQCRSPYVQYTLQRTNMHGVLLRSTLPPSLPPFLPSSLPLTLYRNNRGVVVCTSINCWPKYRKTAANHLARYDSCCPSQYLELCILVRSSS